MSNKLNILLLEDSHTDSYLLKRILDQQFEYDVTEVMNKVEFESALLNQTFDIILADYNLPQFSGKEALLIRQRLNIGTPQIILSGSLSPTQQIECLELSAADVVDKSDINRIPYVIRRCIAEHLDRERLKEALDELQKSVHEKEILVSEIHHRVKNNLAVISGLLELSKFQNSVDDIVRKIFDDNILRIKSISLVHETLYQDNQMTHVSISQFIKDLLYQTRNFYIHSRPSVEIKNRIQDVLVNINQAVPLGLIITELVTNAMKHAFQDNQEGIIEVNLSESDKRISLIVKDNGVGLPDNIDFNNMASFGTTLVNQLILQLDGKLEITSNNQGVTFNIQFMMSEKRGSSSSMNNNVKLTKKNYSHLLPREPKATTK